MKTKDTRIDFIMREHQRLTKDTEFSKLDPRTQTKSMAEIMAIIIARRSQLNGSD